MKQIDANAVKHTATDKLIEAHRALDKKIEGLPTYRARSPEETSMKQQRCDIKTELMGRACAGDAIAASYAVHRQWVSPSKFDVDPHAWEPEVIEGDAVSEMARDELVLSSVRKGVAVA